MQTLNDLLCSQKQFVLNTNGILERGETVPGNKYPDSRARFWAIYAKCTWMPVPEGFSRLEGLQGLRHQPSFLLLPCDFKLNGNLIFKRIGMCNFKPESPILTGFLLAQPSDSFYSSRLYSIPHSRFDELTGFFRKCLRSKAHFYFFSIAKDRSNHSILNLYVWPSSMLC